VTVRLFHPFRNLGNKGFGQIGGKRRRREIAQLQQSALFDRTWYLESYPDVSASGVDPVRHYLESGWREGRDPGPKFCTSTYLRANSDVAAQGVNPLLHYIQYGQFEGRGAPDQAHPIHALADPVDIFGEGAPCARFALPRQTPMRWTRAGRIVDRGDRTIKVDGFTVSNASDQISADQARHAIALLAWLSGQGERPSQFALLGGSPSSLQDCWYAGWGLLRTRWAATGDQPVVVRAIQQVGEQPELVGEACIASPLDFMDVRPKNPFFPLLFLFADVDGGLLGYRLLAFPSLCRGGLHYSELVALVPRANDAFDSAKTDERLTERLLSLRRGNALPLVGLLTVALDRADGTQPLFQSEFRVWLSKVMRVPVRVAEEPGDHAGQFLANALVLEPPDARTNGVAELKIRADMAPSLSALTANAHDGDVAAEVVGSIVLAPDDSSAPAIHLRVPDGTSAADMPGHSTALPTISPLASSNLLPAEPGLLAVRAAAARRPNDTELLVPNASLQTAAETEFEATAWLIWPDDWIEEHLVDALQSLALQTVTPGSITFVGEVSSKVKELAEALFGDKAAVATDRAKAADLIDTRFAAYLGPGILLHDRRTVAALVPMLSQPGTLTVSAPAVFAEPRANAWVVSSQEGELDTGMTMLGSSAFPLPEPPFHFWIARAGLVQDWLRNGPPGDATGTHVRSTLVSVSALDRRRHRQPPITLPLPDLGMRAELIIG